MLSVRPDFLALEGLAAADLARWSAYGSAYGTDTYHGGPVARSPSEHGSSCRRRRGESRRPQRGRTGPCAGPASPLGHGVSAGTIEVSVLAFSHGGYFSPKRARYPIAPAQVLVGTGPASNASDEMRRSLRILCGPRGGGVISPMSGCTENRRNASMLIMRLGPVSQTLG